MQLSLFFFFSFFKPQVLYSIAFISKCSLGTGFRNKDHLAIKGMILFKLLLYGECSLVRTVQGENGACGFIEAIEKEKYGEAVLFRHKEKWR